MFVLLFVEWPVRYCH